MKKTVILSVVCSILLLCVCFALSKKNNVNHNQNNKADAPAGNMTTETTSESEAELEGKTDGTAKNEPEGEEEKRGNNAGNIMYDAELAQSGEWLYYANPDDDDKMYRKKTDGSSEQKLNNVSSDYINVCDDWIYYLNEPYGDEKVRLYRMKIDGTEIQYPLGSIEFLTLNPVVTGEWIYFIDEKSWLCKIRTDGTELTLISRKDTTSELIVVNDWIYYDVGGCIYRMKTDGTEDTLLVEKNYIWDYCATEDALLYTYSKDKYSEEEQGELLLLDRDTSQEEN